jgi:hypothetical protein
MKQYKVNKIRGIVALLATGLILGGCASSPSTFSAADQSVDFNQYKTYAFMQDLSTDQRDYQSLESTYLKDSVAREMEQRGFRQSPTPELLINFSIDSEEKVRSRSVPSSGLYVDPFYGYSYGVGYETRIDQYTEGRLNIVAVDVEGQRLVWEGTTKGRITAKVAANIEGTLDEAVSEVFKQFPVTAGVANISYSQH